VIPLHIVVVVVVAYLTSDEGGFVVELFAVVHNRPAGVDMDLSCVFRVCWINLQRGRYDRLG